MTRTEMTERIDAMPDARAIGQAYFVANEDGEPAGTYEFCREHALALRWWFEIEDGKESWIAATTMGSDGARRCAFGGCNKPLTCGHLTDHGIDDALALTEPDPMKSHIYPAELSLAAASMCDDDPRWTTWDAHARRLLRRVPRG